MRGSVRFVRSWWRMDVESDGGDELEIEREWRW